jgi:hypothetical protein
MQRSNLAAPDACGLQLRRCVSFVAQLGQRGGNEVRPDTVALL